MPATPAVEELRARRLERGEQVLEIGSGSGQSADRDGMSRSVTESEQHNAADTTCKLEPRALDVLVRHTVAAKVKRGAEEECKQT
jgi:hypothetical protein